MRAEYVAYHKKPCLKFMQTLDKDLMKILERSAKKRGIVLQEYLRAVVIPEWLMHQKILKAKRRKS